MNEKLKTPESLPLIPLRDLVLFPGFTVSLFIGRESSKNAVHASIKENRRIFLCTQKDSNVHNPLGKDIHRIGVVAEILQMLKLPDDTLKILVEVLYRGEWEKIENFTIQKTEPGHSVKNSSSENYLLFEAPNLKGKNKSEAAEKKLTILPIIEKEPDAFAGAGKKEAGNSFYAKALVNAKISRNFDPTIHDLKRRLVQQFNKYAKTVSEYSKEFLKDIATLKNPEKTMDQISGRIPIPPEKKQDILKEINLKKRMHLVMDAIQSLIGLQDLDKKIQRNVHDRISKTQKDYYLSEKIKEIRKEMGHELDLFEEADELKKRQAAKNLPKEAKDKVLKEIAKLEKIPPLSAEVTVLRNYIDWMLDLPWSEMSPDNTDLDHAQMILNRDHHGLVEVKDRILDFIVVQRFVEKLKGPILCFVGPPGVGKTSLARSIASALEREFVRISLGGIKDEAEIRGHRKTYVGALPGRIIQSMKKSKTVNPVFLLDEIDKLSSDFRGDPASALLEVLDPEQNWSFQDHYLEVHYDLSRVLFIATANALHKIPGPLRDRMEIIELSGYSEIEKLQIGRKFLLPKALMENGLNESQLRISNSNLYYIIRHYTREAGVRNLDRALHKVSRKSLRKLVEKKSSTKNKNERDQITEILYLNRDMLKEFLGNELFRIHFSEEKEEVGYCNGMAWTENGGDLLGVEAVLTDGKGMLQVTGNLGQVMQESVKAALTYMRSVKEILGIDGGLMKKKDIHVHVPEGAIPKDGPSAGITIAIAMISAFTGIPVKKNLAMTGEITLRGKVLPVGGVKEKVLAAHRSQIREIILPKENEKSLKEIPDFVKKRIRFHLVSRMSEVISLALAENIEKISELSAGLPLKTANGKNIEQNIIQ